MCGIPQASRSLRFSTSPSKPVDKTAATARTVAFARNKKSSGVFRRGERARRKALEPVVVARISTAVHATSALLTNAVALNCGNEHRIISGSFLLARGELQLVKRFRM